jgi:hypothetical protein
MGIYYGQYKTGEGLHGVGLMKGGVWMVGGGTWGVS